MSLSNQKNYIVINNYLSTGNVWNLNPVSTNDPKVMTEAFLWAKNWKNKKKMFKMSAKVNLTLNSWFKHLQTIYHIDNVYGNYGNIVLVLDNLLLSVFSYFIPTMECM